VRRGPGRARQAPDQRSAASGLIWLRPAGDPGLGHVWAQRPAFGRLRLHRAAHPTGRQDRERRRISAGQNA
jgi:hypothetical protein